MISVGFSFWSDENAVDLCIGDFSMIVNIPKNKNGHRVYVMIYEVYLNKVIYNIYIYE